MALMSVGLVRSSWAELPFVNERSTKKVCMMKAREILLTPAQGKADVVSSILEPFAFGLGVKDMVPAGFVDRVAEANVWGRCAVQNCCTSQSFFPSVQ